MIGINRKTTRNHSQRVRRLGAATVLALAANYATAACEYDGVYYEHGTVICFGGWLQECTVADYWSAVGMCRAETPDDGKADLALIARSSSVLRKRLEAPAAEDQVADQPAS